MNAVPQADTSGARFAAIDVRFAPELLGMGLIEDAERPSWIAERVVWPSALGWFTTG